MAIERVRALVFDVFGTVVDWRGSIIREGAALGRARGLDIDWPRFADEWRRDGYHGGMARIRSGQAPYMSTDALFRTKLDELLPKYGITGLSEAEVEHVNHVWRRLTPWPDAVAGLTRLRQTFIIAPLSNGTFATLTVMAKNAGLPWDCIISSELRGTFKPDREAYLLAPTLLDLEPDQVMLVAAHGNDLRAAQANGLRAGFVPRPLEWGPDGAQESPPDPPIDVVATDFLDLADKLGA